MLKLKTVCTSFRPIDPAKIRTRLRLFPKANPLLKASGFAFFAHMPTLEAVCLRAMVTTLSHRYASPRELAGDVERSLADEPVSAFSEPVIVKTRL